MDRHHSEKAAPHSPITAEVAVNSTNANVTRPRSGRQGLASEGGQMALPLRSWAIVALITVSPGRRGTQVPTCTSPLM